jgi:nuclease S1
VNRLLKIVAVVSLGLDLRSSHALAWGTEGHQVIAILAQKHLTPSAATAVKELLGAQQLADVALWADAIKASARPETRPWHYVLIPDASATFDDKRDCPSRACVVDKIVDFAAVLKNAGASREQRTEALKFLVHFVADLHQPLHCEDHGDNLSHGMAADYPSPGNKLGHTDFHVVWDTSVVLTDMGGRNVATYAAQLDAQVASRLDAWRAWSAGTPADWANDSHRIAQKIYAELGNPAPGTTLKLGSGYGMAHAAIVEEQLERAGVRLGAILNRDLGQ